MCLAPGIGFLPAWRCKDGVLEAIQARLHGHAKDTRYLRNLIYSGALHIYIDGLNEVDGATREKIVGFAEQFFRAHVLIATQPMTWQPPSGARRYRLEPLGRDGIRGFLHSRAAYLPGDARRTGDAFVKACDEYLDSLTELPEVLANPMDLGTVADLIARAIEPDLMALQEQQYQLMVAEYRKRHRNRAFPLDRLAREAYAMRAADRYAIDKAGLGDELACMEDFKMVVPRRDDAGGEDYEFRHDKIHEFFIAHLFAMPESEDIRLAHLGEPRFHGVYLLLAMSWPCAQVMALRERILTHAREHKDYRLFEDFEPIRVRRCAPAE